MTGSSRMVRSVRGVCILVGTTCRCTAGPSRRCFAAWPSYLAAEQRKQGGAGPESDSGRVLIAKVS